MRIIIIGAGNAGRHIAETMCELNHDVVLVDNRSEPLAEVDAHLDILTLQGPGACPTTLEQAGIEQADLLVAVTDRDTVNILACAYAHAAQVKNKVARVVNPAFTDKSSRLNLRELGVDLVVSHKEECAREIFNILRMPGTLEVVDLLGGRALAVGLKVPTTSPLIRAPLKAFPDAELLKKFRFIAAIRGNELIIPGGDTQFMIGDDIYVVMQPNQVGEFIDWACPDHPTFEKVIIGGGGDLGLSLAKRLEQLSLQIVLLEDDPDRAEYISGALNRTLVMNADLLDRETLVNAGIVENTAFVAVTGDDENNIISCLLAEKEGVSFTLAQVTKPAYVPIINSLSLLDRAVSPHLSMTNAILHFVRGQHVTRAALLHNLPGELLEIELAANSRWAGKAIREIRIPRDALIATVLRAETVCTATGDLRLNVGDRLVLFSAPKAVEKLEAIFRK